MNKYTINNLFHNRINLTEPLLFNDPFDSIFHINIHDNFKWLQWGIHHGINTKYQAEQIEFEAMRANKKRSKVFQTFYQQMLRVASLTTNYNNSLMWSHYSDSDRGICIDYYVPEYKYRNYIFPTIYSNSILDLSDLGDPDNWDSKRLISAMICCGVVKQSIWKYENEWRLMMPWGAFDWLEEKPRFSLTAPRISRIFLGPNFVGYWNQIKHHNKPNGEKHFKDLKNYFYPFCDFIEKNRIPIYIMQIEPGHYKLNVSKEINVDVLKYLDTDSLHKYYSIPLLGYY